MTLKISIAVGIDVCKRFLDVFHSQTRARALTTTPKGSPDSIDWLTTQNAADAIVLEATGGYEALCWRALEASGLPVARLNPKRVRDHARAAGILAKTDRLDAEVITAYAPRTPGRSNAPKTAVLREPEAWLVRRSQLIEARGRDQPKASRPEGRAQAHRRPLACLEPRDRGHRRSTSGRPGRQRGLARETRAT